MIVLLTSLATGYFLSGSDSSDEDGTGSIILTVIGSVVAVIVLIIAGAALFLYLGVGEQVVKPIVGLVESYIKALFSFFGVLAAPLIKLLAVL